MNSDFEFVQKRFAIGKERREGIDMMMDRVIKQLEGWLAFDE